MDRRKFLQAAGIAAAGLGIAPEALAQIVKVNGSVPGSISMDGKPGQVSDGVEKHIPVKGYVREPARRIPVVAAADVVVAGGGAAGVSAAVSAARLGASVILIEKANFLGGLWTGGLVLPVLATHGKGKTAAWDKASMGFCEEVCSTLLQNGWAENPLNPKADPEAAKYLLDRYLVQSGVTTLYNSTVCGVTMKAGKIRSVLVDCNLGRIAIECSVAVDASGDGMLFSHTGDPHQARRYHMSTSYRVGGLTERKGWRSSPVPGMSYAAHGQMEAMDGLDVFKVSATQQRHRLEIWDKVQKDKETNPGIFLMECGPTTGVRVTRVLDSLHNVTLDESMEWTQFEDVIGMAGGCDPFNYKGTRIERKDRPVWQIPYRSLLPRETGNLLVAGRCFGYDQEIAWDAREISTCFVTGQAAGTAAALVARKGCAAKDLDVELLQKKLRESNVRLDF